MVSFGRINALDGLSFTWQGAKKRLGIIGPNGSGKSTLFKVLSGFVLPTSGVVKFNGENIAGMPADKINHHGIARTFQIPKPFMELTVFENIYVSALQRTDKHDSTEVSLKYLHDFGLKEKSRLRPDGLSLIEKRLLEIARALATQPKLLLLDEVLAGLRSQEVDKILKVIMKIQNENHFHIVMVEHNIKAIKDFCEELIVLNTGALIASGNVDHCLQNKTVKEVYLGQTPVL